MRTQGEIHEDKLGRMIRDSTLPFDGCTGMIKRPPHTATLRFEKPGEALIQIWGRRIGVDTPPLGAPTVIEHCVMVQQPCPRWCLEMEVANLRFRQGLNQLFLAGSGPP